MAPEPIIPPCQITSAAWQVLATMNLPWNQTIVSGPHVDIADGLTLTFLGDPDQADTPGPPGLTVAIATLYASELFFDLLTGQGDYLAEELDDPGVVIGRRYGEAQALLYTWAQEASPVLGPPDWHHSRETVRWILPQMNLTLQVTQEDKELPVEAQLILTPPGTWPMDWGS